MQFLGLRHHGEAPKVTAEERMHEDRLFMRIESSQDADKAALANYPGLLGKLGDFEVDPALAAQLEARNTTDQTDNSTNTNGEVTTPEYGTAQVAGLIANVPTTTIDMPANDQPDMIHEPQSAQVDGAYYESIS